MLLTVLEVLGLACVVAGVGLWLGLAAALIVGGVLLVVVVNVIERRRPSSPLAGPPA